MTRFLRLLKIYRVANRYRLGELFDSLEQAQLLSMLLALPLPAVPNIDTLNRGKRLRLALQELGPIFIKFGQLLSTRRDMVPEDIADELAILQDNVEPFPEQQAIALIEKALDDSIENLFAEFSPTPLASASVAQVHTATLKTGEDVVVKVIRPGIEKIITQDIALLKSVAAFVENNIDQGKRLRAVEVVKDYEYIIHDELNLMSEGANGTQLARNFENSDLLYVPKVYWDYCRINVLVMERIYGIPVSHIEELKAAGIDLKVLAERGVEIFFTQVFNHSFFHADMHPGNVYVSREHPEKPQYIALDCAIIGTLSKDDQYYLARNLLAIFKRDYRKVAELHVECGWVPPHTPINAFEATMRSVCEPIFEKPLKDISFGMLLLQLFRTASRFNMEVQPSLVLLQKTLLNVEGLGKQLYPDLDLWENALPFLENWQRERLSPISNLKKITEKLPEWLEHLPEIPELIF
ncbi:MAG: ubiquinone biosynthesis regulatory protein kinase UbiB, partial [Gammaproteobacteria bacterium]|nr:ubiquinone biosynthesis regulatory protein kinase UbiB [Gammaproteobacteria bacterium]